jgi:hypothetical protein
MRQFDSALKGTRLFHAARSMRARFVSNFTRLAYNVGNFLRSPPIPKAIAEWSLTTPREKLIKIGAKVISQGRYVAF